MLHNPDPRRDTTSLDEPIMWQEITRVARAALREAAEGDAASPPVHTRMRATTASGAAWDLRAQPLLQAGTGQSIIVVAVERLDAGAARTSAENEIDEVRHRFGLSPRQAEVATLLARRLTDKEIAGRLGISRHTARRHVEVTLSRLRVHSRAEVADVLGLDPETLARVAGVAM